MRKRPTKDITQIKMLLPSCSRHKFQEEKKIIKFVKDVKSTTHADIHNRIWLFHMTYYPVLSVYSNWFFFSCCLIHFTCACVLLFSPVTCILSMSQVVGYVYHYCVCLYTVVRYVLVVSSHNLKTLDNIYPQSVFATKSNTTILVCLIAPQC